MGFEMGFGFSLGFEMGFGFSLGFEVGFGVGGLEEVVVVVEEGFLSEAFLSDSQRDDLR